VEGIGLYAVQSLVCNNTADQRLTGRIHAACIRPDLQIGAGRAAAVRESVIRNNLVRSRRGSPTKRSKSAMRTIGRLSALSGWPTMDANGISSRGGTARSPPAPGSLLDERHVGAMERIPHRRASQTAERSSCGFRGHCGRQPYVDRGTNPLDGGRRRSCRPPRASKGSRDSAPGIRDLRSGQLVIGHAA
jgi:hypothetical protein